MSRAIKKFNGLNGTIGIDEVQKLADLAKQEGQTHLYNRLTAGLEEAKKHKAVQFNPGRLAVEEIPSCDLPGIDPIPSYITADEFTGLNKAVSPDDIYQYITDLILKRIEKADSLPWHTMWENTPDAANFKTYYNFESKKAYRGINFMLLNLDEFGNLVFRENPYFLTFKQIEKNKGKLRKGASATRVVYFTKLYRFVHFNKETSEKQLEYATYNHKKYVNWLEKNKAQIESLTGKSIDLEKNKYLPILKYYNVFSGEDIDDIDFGDYPKSNTITRTDDEKIEAAEAIVSKYPSPPKVLFRGNQPAYYPMRDEILMTPANQFKNTQFFYSVFFHELTHSTGHSKRLDRGNDTRRRDGSKEDKKAYDFEELVAEMGSVFLCAESGILFHTRDQSAKYLSHYMGKLKKIMKDDNRFFFRAASASQAAADHILDRDKDGIPAYIKQLGKKGGSSTPKKEVAAVPAEKEVTAGKDGIFPETVLQLPKKKLTKKELEAANPAPKAIKPKSISVASAIDDILSLDKYKGISKIQANILYKYFKDDIDNMEFDGYGDSVKYYDITGFENGNMKKETNFHILMRDYDDKGALCLTKAGRELVASIKNRVESKRNQKQNYALFDGLAATAQNSDTISFNKQIIKAKKNGIKPTQEFNLGNSKDELLLHIGKNKIILLGATIKKAMAKNDSHLLRWEHLINLPDRINNPLAIFKSKTAGFVILTELINEKEKPVMVAIHADKTLKINQIKSMYSRKNDRTYQKWEEEGLLLFKDKKSDLLGRVFLGTIPNSPNKPLSKNKVTKTKPNNKNTGLKSPTIEPKPIEDGQGYSGEKPRPLISGKHPKVRNIRHQQERSPMFRIDGETAKFLQAVEKKPIDSVVVTLDGPQGAGKTTAVYKFQNDFATAGNRCLFASLEEHPTSNLAQEKRDLHLSPQAQENIDTVAEFEDYQEFCEIVKNYDAIFIDSWQKLIRMIGSIRLDEDIRKKFDGKVFFIIFQQTVDGRTKGGAEIVFDGDIIIKLEKLPSFRDNFAYFDKNRYTTVPIENLKYMILDGVCVNTEEAEASPEPEMANTPESEEVFDFNVY